MGIRVESVGLKLGFIFEQAIEDVNRFPYATGNKMAKQGDVRVANVVVGDAAKLAVAHMLRAQQIVFNQFDMGAIGNRRLATLPETAWVTLQPCPIFLNGFSGRMQARCIDMGQIPGKRPSSWYLKELQLYLQ